MSGEQGITIVGRLTADPELRFTSSGHAVASFQVASNARKYDKATSEWTDQPPNWWRCSAWRDLAESVAESLTKGTAVILQGELKTREWTDKDGGKRSSLEVDVQAIGPDLRWATAKVTRAQRGTPDPRVPSNARGGSTERDPWATPAPATTAWGTESPEIPF